MAVISMTVRGSAELKRNLARLQGAERRRAQADGLEAGIRVLETHVKDSLRQPGSGREYVRGNVTHRASKPGEPPAMDIGNLINSVMIDEVTSTQAILGVHAEYGPHLEFGTYKMAARPFLRPALDEHEREIIGAVEAVIASFVESIHA